MDAGNTIQQFLKYNLWKDFIIYLTFKTMAIEQQRFMIVIFFTMCIYYERMHSHCRCKLKFLCIFPALKCSVTVHYTIEVLLPCRSKTADSLTPYTPITADSLYVSAFLHQFTVSHLCRFYVSPSSHCGWARFRQPGSRHHNCLLSLHNLMQMSSACLRACDVSSLIDRRIQATLQYSPCKTIDEASKPSDAKKLFKLMQLCFINIMEIFEYNWDREYIVIYLYIIKQRPHNEILNTSLKNSN